MKWFGTFLLQWHQLDINTGSKTSKQHLSVSACLKRLSEIYYGVNITGLHSQLMRVKEHPGWGKISAMCLEYWQWADQYYLVWDYVKLISGLRGHLFYWEQTAASFIALLTKSLQISDLNCDQRRSLRREWWKRLLCCLSSFCFNPVKHLKTPMWCSLMTYSLFISPETVFPESGCILVSVMNLPFLLWLCSWTRNETLWPCDLDDFWDRYWWNSVEPIFKV